MDKTPLIDSNLLTYVFDANEPKKRRICKNLLSKCWKGDEIYAVSVQNLSEFYVAVTEKIENPMPKEIAGKFIKLIIEFENWKIMNFDEHSISLAIEINEKYGIPYWDALIVATMKENGITCIYTENEKDFQKIPWLEVINPVKG